MSDDLRDDSHRLSVLVTPLQPPFSEDVMYFTMDDGRQLAVSKADGEAMKMLMGGSKHAVGRRIELSQVDNNTEQIRVLVLWDA